VCKHLIGYPFHSSNLARTSDNASIASVLRVMRFSQGFLRLIAASAMSVAATISIVANLVPTKTALPSAASSDTSFPNTLATYLTL
jgi:hypothetical protein